MLILWHLCHICQLKKTLDMSLFWFVNIQKVLKQGIQVQYKTDLDLSWVTRMKAYIEFLFEWLSFGRNCYVLSKLYCWTSGEWLTGKEKWFVKNSEKKVIWSMHFHHSLFMLWYFLRWQILAILKVRGHIFMLVLYSCNALMISTKSFNFHRYYFGCRD